MSGSENNTRGKNTRVRSTPKEVELQSTKTLAWSSHEKRLLLQGLQKYGLHDLEKVSAIVGTKNVAEVTFFCEQRRLKVIRDKKLKKDKDVTEEEIHLAGIQQWYDKIKSSIEPRMRGRDYTLSALTDIFKMLAEQESKCPVTPKMPDFGSIYKYFTSILSGKIPPVMSTLDSLVVLTMVKKLSVILISNNFAEEKELLNNLSNRKQVEVRKGLKIEERHRAGGRKMSRKKVVARKRRAGIQNNGAASKNSILGDSDETRNANGLGGNLISIDGAGDSAFNMNNSESKLSEDSLYNKYPKLDLSSHSSRAVIYSMNPLQIPVEFLRKDFKIVHK